MLLCVVCSLSVWHVRGDQKVFIEWGNGLGIERKEWMDDRGQWIRLGACARGLVELMGQEGALGWCPYSVWHWLISLGFDNSLCVLITCAWTKIQKLGIRGEKWKINTVHRNSVKYSIKIFLHPSRRVVFKLNHSDEYILHHCTEVHNCLSSQKQ